MSQLRDGTINSISCSMTNNLCHNYRFSKPDYSLNGGVRGIARCSDIMFNIMHVNHQHDLVLMED